MKRRDFLMLAHTYDPEKHNVEGWLASEKYDGMRAFWDGGFSAGLMSHTVPYANTLKDKKIVAATGLWSRKAKVIWAPKWWLDRLPRVLLDGELWSPTLTFQEIVSITRSQSADSRWEQIYFMVFDVPCPTDVFSDGAIYTGKGEREIVIQGAEQWWRARGGESVLDGTEYFLVRQSLIGNIRIDGVCPVEQTVVKSRTHLQELLDNVFEVGGEGLIVRNPLSLWQPTRVNTMLKVKDSHDAEAIVLGTVEGKGRLSGMVGALLVKWGDKEFEIGTGFDDSERRIGHFTIGEEITFRYRELTLDGIPKEGRYLRKRTE